MQDTDDIILMEKVALGDESAFKEIVRRYQRKVINLIFRYLLSKEDAQDLAQDVFVKIWNTADTFKGKASLYTWIYRIAVNFSLNYIRKKKKAKFFDAHISYEEGVAKKEIPLSIVPAPDAILEEKELKDIIENAIKNLSDLQKTAFILSKYEKHSYIEISNIMNLSISSVESLLFRAKKNMKKYILKALKQ